MDKFLEPLKVMKCIQRLPNSAILSISISRDGQRGHHGQLVQNPVVTHSNIEHVFAKSMILTKNA